MGIFLSELINQAQECLKDLGLLPGTIDDYMCSAFRPIERRLGNQVITDSNIITSQEDFFLEQFSNGEISRQPRNWRIRGIRVLSEVFETGSFSWKVYSKKEKPVLPEAYASVLDGYISTQECGQKRKTCKKSICQRFLLSLADGGVSELSAIQPCHVRDFVADISKDRPKSMDDVIYALRGFFRYLCDEGMYDDSHWMLLTAPRCRDLRVRGCLSADEIASLLGSIPRDTPDGKRDFAAMSLAAVSGLRAGDIASLKFNDIDWKRHEIRIVQGKTSEYLVLPVSKSLLDVLADYILNGRPETGDRHIFVRHCAPFRGYHDGVSIACIFRKYQKKADIGHSIGDGKTLHGMRRGLGTGMAENGIPVDLIAQVLGHTGTRATRQYISANMQRLRECALGFDSLGGAL